MRLYRFIKAFTCVFVFISLFDVSLWAQSETTKKTGVADYYKRKVDGIILKNDTKNISGKIVAFRKEGIIFRRAKEGPLHNPKPEYIPINQIQAFVDNKGTPVWGEIPRTKKYDFLKLRHYSTKFAVQIGMGQHTHSASFTPLISQYDNYVQDVKNGRTIGLQAAYFLAPHYSVGVKYFNHEAKANIYSLSSESVPAIQDDITIHNYMFDFTYYQAVSQMVIFYADLAMGGLFYRNDRTLVTGEAEISATSFSTVLSGGVDFLVTRNIGLGFELSYLFGGISNPDVHGDTAAIKDTQNLNRFDVTGGVKVYF